MVTVTGDRLCGAGSPRNLTLIFDGPESYPGSGGGGNEVPFTATGNGFVAHYRIPPTYTAAYRDGQTGPSQVPVRPGTGYGFFTLPAGGCTVPLTVTR
jgi:hypothetical protein